MNHPNADTQEDALDPYDLDRLVIDSEYRRAVMRRLKAESARKRDETLEPAYLQGASFDQE
jgi:hypothetical protein